MVGLALALGFARTSIAQFIPLPAVTWTGSDAAPAFRTLKAVPVTPATAFSTQGGSATSTNGLCRDHPSIPQVCVGGVTPQSGEFLELSRSLRNDPDLIYEFVRNGIDTEFQFGLTKGDEGTIVDRSGTAFDQAKLLVDLLRQAGFTARYKFGDIALTPAQLEQWTGFTDARAACDFFASGGIPVSINGSSTACNQTGTVTSSTIAHVWVEAEIQGQTVQLDPAFKPYTHYAGLDVRTMAGMSAGVPLSTAVQGVSRTDSGATTRNYNSSGLKTYLTARADALRTALRSDVNRGKSIKEVVGGRAIIDGARPVGGWRATSLAHVSSVRATWSGGVPNAYRTTLTLQMVPYLAQQTTLTANVFADEVYGYPIVIGPSGMGYGRGGGVSAPQGTACQRMQPCNERATVTMNRPFAAQGAAYGDTVISRPIKEWDYTVVVLGFGDSSPDKARRWGRLFQETYLGAEYGGVGLHLRPTLAASWLAQFTAASDLQGELAESRVTHLHTLGFVYAIHTDGYDLRTDFTNIIDLETAVAVTSREGSATKRRSLIHALAAAAAALEGSVAEQTSTNPASASTARRMAWANDPGEGENVSKYYRIASGSAAPAAETFTSGGAALGSPTQAQPFRSAVTAYLGKGFTITTASDVLLGPGRSTGEHLENGSLYAGPSTERGGAFVATKYDVNGDPVEIAHVVTNHYVAAKGGGAPAADAGAPNPSDLIKDPFEDRSSVEGVDLRSGQMSYSTPILNSRGQGEFPHQLSERLELRGGGFNVYHLASRNISVVLTPRATSGLVSNFDGSVELTSSGMEAMGQSQAEAAAATIVAFAALQDVYAGTPNADSDVAGALVADWWGRALVYNAITLKQGGSASEYLFGGREGGRKVFRAKTGASRVYADGDLQVALVQGTGGQWNRAERFELVDTSIQFEAVDGDETKRTYQAVERMGQRLKTWSFPSGVVLTVGYGAFGGYVPTTVSSNLGVNLTLNPHPLTGALDWQAHPAGITTWRCNDYYGGGVFTVTDAANQTYRYKAVMAAGDHCLIEEIYSPRSATTPVKTYTYDAFDRVREVRDAVAVASPSERGSYKIFAIPGFRGERENPLGGRYAVQTGNDGRFERHIDEMGRASTATFDGRGRVLTRTSAWGDQTAFKYDDRDNLIERTQTPITGCATGLTTEQAAWWCQTITVKAEYHATWNKPTKVTLPATQADPTPRDWTMVYNAKGLVETITGPSVYNGMSGANGNPLWTTWYDAYGRITQTEDPTGRRSTQTWGGGTLPAYCLRLATASTQSGGLNLTTTYGCDAVGNVTTVTDPRGNTTTTAYDALRRKTGVTGPSGTNIQTQWLYDGDGNVKEEKRWDATAAAWRITTNTWSATGKLLTVTDPSGDLARTCYDQLDRPIAAIDPERRATLTSYNAASQPTEIRRWYRAAAGACSWTAELPSGQTEDRWRRTLYNAAGLPSAEIDARGNSTQQIYDGLGRPAKTIYADGSEAWTAQDQRGNAIARRQRGGRRAAVFYDAAGRDYHVREFEAADVGISWRGRNSRASYDLAGRPVWRDVSTQTSTNGVFDAALTRDVRYYTYDAAARLTTDQWQPDGTSSGPTLSLTYGYDAAGNRTSITWPGSVTATYGYDAANRATSVSFPGTGGTQTVALTYDSLSRRTGVNRPGSAADTSYGYEADSDLASMGHAFTGGSGVGAVSFSYGHDAAGKITSIGSTQPALEWMPALAYARSYGPANVLNQVSSEAGVALGYDTDGNMTSDGVTTFTWTYGNRMSGASRSGMTATYAYDSDDRRTKKTVNGVVTRTMWSGTDEVAELDASGNILRRFVPDGSGGMDARLATVEASGTVYWHHTDHQGSVIATSGANGQTVATASYSPFGEFGSGVTTTPTGSPFGYTGRQYDPETGLYQYRARYYSPRLGQFLSTDPIGTKDDPNLHLYVGNDPVNRTDPTGACFTYPCTQGLLSSANPFYKLANYLGPPSAYVPRERTTYFVGDLNIVVGAGAMFEAGGYIWTKDGQEVERGLVLGVHGAFGVDFALQGGVAVKMGAPESGLQISYQVGASVGAVGGEISGDVGEAPDTIAATGGGAPPSPLLKSPVSGTVSVGVMGHFPISSPEQAERFEAFEDTATVRDQQRRCEQDKDAC